MATDKRRGPETLNVAVTFWVGFTQLPVPAHPPDHPAKTEPLAGAAVKVTGKLEVLALYSLQLGPQLIAVLELLTVPDPVLDGSIDAVR